MVRFTAHTSDISDSDHEIEDVFSVRPSAPARPSKTSDRRPPPARTKKPLRPPPPGPEESDSEDESSGSESDEVELLPPVKPRKTRPTRNALVQGADGEIHYSHEVDGGRERSTSASPPPSRKPPREGSPWAEQVGVDPQRLHVMQAALFRAPEEEAALKVLQAQKRASILADRSLNRKHSRDSEEGGLHADAKDRASFAQHVDAVPIQQPRKYSRVEASASLVRGCEHSIIDAGLALGRSFRVGWGPGGIISHVGALCAPAASSTNTANSSIVSLTVVPVAYYQSKDIADYMSDLLHHHLDHSTIELDENGVPFATPSATLCFSSLASTYSPTDRSYEAYLFRLGSALFDEIDLRLDESIPPEVRKRVSDVRRKAALSTWLEDAVAPLVEEDLKKNSPPDGAATYFTLLTGNQIDRACEAALEDRNYRLASLIAQASWADHEFRSDLRKQVQVWREERIDVHISEPMRKVYALMAGIVGKLEGSTGTGLEKCSDIIVHEGLDWKRMYGLYLWYAMPGEAPLHEVFEAYEEFCESTPSSAPTYAQHAETITSRTPIDALFSLFKLQADPKCSLSHILDPLSYTSSPLDYFLPWHMYIILSRSMRIRDFSDRGDPGMDIDTDHSIDAETRVEGHSPTADLMTSSYAFELESYGLIQEAAFVLMHLEGPYGRRKAIMDLLMRSAPYLDEHMRRGLRSLRVPIAWVNESLATYKLAYGNVYGAYELYLSGGMYDAAHDLAVLELAPDAINSRDLESLKAIMERFKGHPVEGWNERGKLLDYANVMIRMPQLRELIEDGEDVPENADAELEELAKMLPALIEKAPLILPRSDPAHTAAVADMVSQMTQMLKPYGFIPSRKQPTVLGGAAKLRQINSSAYERFVNNIRSA